MDGFLVVDKPVGMSSHDVVSAVRRLACQKKVGHTGTLDPFATGVLPVALGEGTKAIQFLDESVKEYRAVMRLGISTDTQDCTGTTVRLGEWSRLSPEEVAGVAETFIGRCEQIPPMYSALKRDGIPLYKLARKGEVVRRDARRIEIYSLSIEYIDLPTVAFSVSCSRGTYIRTLASDMGDRLGCGAHLEELRRTASGPFNMQMALPLDQLIREAAEKTLEDRLISCSAALGHLRPLALTEEGANRVAHGVSPQPGEVTELGAAELEPGERIRLVKGPRLLAIAENDRTEGAREGANLRLLRVFNQH